MVARLKLKDIDGRAPPGVKVLHSSSAPLQRRPHSLRSVGGIMSWLTAERCWSPLDGGLHTNFAGKLQDSGHPPSRRKVLGMVTDPDVDF